MPGHFFFCEYVEVPSDLEPEELDDFAEMSMTGLTPFPLDQLAWGFHQDPQCSWMALYAVTLETLARAGLRDIEGFRQVYPSFVSALGFQFDKPTGFFIYDECPEASEDSGSLTLFLHPGLPPKQPQESDDDDPAEDIPPVEIQLPVLHSLPVPLPDQQDSGEEDEEETTAEAAAPDIESVRARLFRMIPEEEGYEVMPSWLRESGYEFSSKDGGVSFLHAWEESEADAPGPDSLLDGEIDIWRADIRDVQFKTQEKKNRKMERYLARAGMVAGIAAILLIFLEILTTIGGSWTKSLQAKVDNNSPQVTSIMSKRDLLTKIEQLSTNNLRPFQMLQVLNDYRVGGIHFQSIDAKEGNRISVKGVAGNGGEVNSYKEALLQSTKVIGCETSMRTSGGKTTFEINATFPPVDMAKPVEPPRPAEEPEANPTPVNFPPTSKPLPPPPVAPKSPPPTSPPGGPPPTPASPPATPPTSKPLPPPPVAPKSPPPAPPPDGPPPIPKILPD